jgi:hypothetical protein
MEKKEFVKIIKSLLKEKGFTYINTNKFVIDYPECYVTLWPRFGENYVRINYNICFKAIHEIMNIKDEFKNWDKCDFIVWGILNHYRDTNYKFRENLMQLEPFNLKETLFEMLESYIEPFNNSLKEIVEFINKGRMYNSVLNSNEIVVQPYSFLDDAEEFLLENGMRPIEEFLV